MEDLSKFRSYELSKSMIDDLAMCMDNFLYVYDIKADKYAISETAAERFNLPATEFTDVIEAHKQFVYAEDYQMLMEDLTEMVSGRKDFHNLHYRWIGKDGEVIWINCRGQVINDEDGNPSLMFCEDNNGKNSDNISQRKTRIW